MIASLKDAWKWYESVLTLTRGIRRMGEKHWSKLPWGSFYKVLEAYKGLDANLIEEVNQVRKYRNWVAHGRRGEPQQGVEPKIAYQRLQQFLELMMGSG